MRIPTLLCGAVLLALSSVPVYAAECPGPTAVDFMKDAEVYEDFDVLNAVTFDGQNSTTLLIYRANGGLWVSLFNGDCYVSGPMGIDLFSPPQAPDVQPAPGALKSPKAEVQS